MLPHMIRAVGPKKRKVYVGGVGGVEVASIIAAPQGGASLQANTVLIGSQTFAHPAPGYDGNIEFWLVGTASKPGQSAFDGIYQPQASGEAGRYLYKCQGDETGFVLEQWGWDDINAFLRLKVQGGVNNGKYVDVGSASPPPQNTFGAAGCPNSRATILTNWPGLTLVKSGARRPFNSIIAYSDNTSYSPNSNASYGATSPDSETCAGASLQCFYASGGNSTGLIYNSVKYGEATQYGYGTPINSNARSTASYGCAFIIWKNN